MFLFANHASEKWSASLGKRNQFGLLSRSIAIPARPLESPSTRAFPDEP